MNIQAKPKAVVVLSGGQDSTTCLFWALSQGYDVHTLTFHYQQKHEREIGAALKVAELAGIPREKTYMKIVGKVLEGTSPLVNKDTELEQYADHNSLPGGLEKTFVPMRNQLFLTLAANHAYVRGIDTLITGVCEEDFGGYPDCRRVFIDALEHASSLGTFNEDTGFKNGLKILTPLMFMTKAATCQLAKELPGCYEALAHTHTAYDGAYPPVGHDHATLLRAKGFEQAGLPDPLVVRAYREGLMDLPPTLNYTEPAMLNAGFEVDNGH